jgi:ribonuclease Y
METIYVILIAVAALLVGVACGYFIFLKVIKGRYNDIVDAATKEAEVIKEKKLLEVKEKFLNKKSELEKEVQQRNQHIQTPNHLLTSYRIL